MFKSPTCTGGGGSRRDARLGEWTLWSGRLKAEEEDFQGIEDMEELMRLNIFEVRDSFLAVLSERTESPSWLWMDLDSDMRRPKPRQPLSEEVREGPMLCSRE
jgi:hypothetical protein